MDLNFQSDNVVGASAPVLAALVAANSGPLPSYGADAITHEVVETFSRLFEREVRVFLVGTGTAANALALSTMLSPWGLALCHEEAHVIDDECGAPEFFSHGAKLLGLPGTGAKLDAAQLEARLAALSPSVKQMPAQAVSISQATESGLLYRPAEIAALSQVCRARKIALHMDGARFANALVALGMSAADMTWRAGIDILSFGATKNGCLAAEAIVVFDPALGDSLAYRQKRAGQTFSKARLLAAQFKGYFADDHWLGNARHANRMAARLAEGLLRTPDVRLAWPAETNGVFVILPKALDARLRAVGALYHPWSPRSLPAGEAVRSDEVLVRLVTSFATDPAAVDAVVAAAAS